MTNETLEATAGFSEVRKAARVSPYIEESSSGGGKRDEKHQGVSILMSAKSLPINIRNSIVAGGLLARPAPVPRWSRRP
ncbi:MAG: hypothetical protein IPG49_14715 [Proteobacteria bacterium]|nr:hypothetical protein [Pseudomonadota bacterium]